MRSTKTTSLPWAIVLLVARPYKLVSDSVEHAIRAQPGTLTPEKENDLREHFTAQFSESVSLVRASLWNAIKVVAGAIIAALVSAYVLQAFGVQKSPTWDAWLQYGGVGILLWATLGRAESAIQTVGGGTLPERVDLGVYRGLYIVGTYALALYVAWGQIGV
jgi:hypothetical protein